MTLEQVEYSPKRLETNWNVEIEDGRIHRLTESLRLGRVARLALDRIESDFKSLGIDF